MAFPSAETRLGVRMDELSDDTYVDIVRAETETGTNLIRHSWSNTGTSREFGFGAGASNLSVTLSLTPRRRFDLLAEPVPLQTPAEKVPAKKQAGSYSRSHPLPRWPKSNSSGWKISASISSESTRRGPGRLKN